MTPRGVPAAWALLAFFLPLSVAGANLGWMLVLLARLFPSIVEARMAAMNETA